MRTGNSGDSFALLYLDWIETTKKTAYAVLAASVCLQEYPGPLPECLYKPRNSLTSSEEVTAVSDVVEHI